MNPVRYAPPAYAGDAATLSLRDCIDEVRRLFIDSVRLRLRSDVPVGVLLSGGVDSSSIAAVAHHLQGDLVRRNCCRRSAMMRDSTRPSTSTQWNGI